ncbi:Omega-conotoxin-like 1 [Varanus komodoensis]|nr:Omega-conotoxin-like 1 [Varanus komodoensis]
MESPGAGEQQVDAGAVGAAGPGRAGAAAEEEIDLSLDDIIKRNKKGRTNPRRASWRQQFKYRNPAYSSGKPRFRSWVPRNLQGTWEAPAGNRGCGEERSACADPQHCCQTRCPSGSSHPPSLTTCGHQPLGPFSWDGRSWAPAWTGPAAALPVNFPALFLRDCLYRWFNLKGGGQRDFHHPLLGALERPLPRRAVLRTLGHKEARQLPVFPSGGTFSCRNRENCTLSPLLFRASKFLFQAPISFPLRSP